MITQADKKRFFAEGYLTVPALVPESLCAPVRESIATYLDVDPFDPETWYEPNLTAHGIVPLHHAQSMWDLRQYPPLHEVFSVLYETEALWVSMDRVSFKAPTRGEPVSVDPIHWDVNPAQPQRLSIQGLVYLEDTGEDQGTFCCAQDIFQNLDACLAADPEAARSRRPNTQDQDIVQVPGERGTLLLWHRLLPHSSAANRAASPRWVQYVAMDPAGDAEARAARLTQYREKRPPPWAVRQNIVGQQIPEPGDPARLTPLGRRLVGVDSWDEAANK